MTSEQFGIILLGVMYTAPIAILTVSLGEAFERIRSLEEQVKNFTK